MNKLIHFTESQKNKFINNSIEHSTISDSIEILDNPSNIYEDLVKLDVEYVLFGIYENVGAFANRYFTEASNLWKTILKALLNSESSCDKGVERFTVLGYLDFSEEIKKIEKFDKHKFGDIKKARKLVSEIDQQVSQVIYNIIKAGKKPIIIGGGQNNAYGCLKGAALALNTSINVVNLDNYTDFGIQEGRHNNNGFGYAFNEGFLHKYYIFGLREVNISDYLFRRLNKLKKKVRFSTFESLKIRKETTFTTELDAAYRFIEKEKYGVEIDWRVAKNVPSNKKSLGFNINDISKFITYFKNHRNNAFIHIGEINSYTLSKKEKKKLGKILADLILDIVQIKD